MTEREKLIELLNTAIFPREGADPAEVVAEFLMDNGVRLPVTCGECRHSREMTERERFIYCENVKICTHPEVYIEGNLPVFDNFYCAYGERWLAATKTGIAGEKAIKLLL